MNKVAQPLIIFSIFTVLFHVVLYAVKGCQQVAELLTELPQVEDC